MKRKIAIIAGGDSSEHEVSLRSAAGLYSFMDKDRYDVTIVVFDGKNWHTEDANLSIRMIFLLRVRA